MLENNESLEYPRDNFKASDSIIDLIEPGDYVNGYLIEGIYERTDKHLLCNTFDDEIMIEISNDNLQSIVTKERFDSVKYGVE